MGFFSDYTMQPVTVLHKETLQISFVKKRTIKPPSILGIKG